MAAKALYTSPLLRLKGEWWRMRCRWRAASIDMCYHRLSRLWDIDGYAIRLGLSRTRVEGSYKIKSYDYPGNRVMIETCRKTDVLLINDTIRCMLRDLMAEGDVYVYVDIIE